MSNIKITIEAFGHTGAYYGRTSALTSSIGVWVCYSSGRERSYSFDNDAKACAFIARTFAKHPAAKCYQQIPCCVEPFNFNLYPDYKPQPAVKYLSLLFQNMDPHRLRCTHRYHSVRRY